MALDDAVVMRAEDNFKGKEDFAHASALSVDLEQAATGNSNECRSSFLVRLTWTTKCQP